MSSSYASPSIYCLAILASHSSRKALLQFSSALMISSQICLLPAVCSNCVSSVPFMRKYVIK